MKKVLGWGLLLVAFVLGYGIYLVLNRGNWIADMIAPFVIYACIEGFQKLVLDKEKRWKNN